MLGNNIFYSPSCFFSSLRGNSYALVKGGRTAPPNHLCPATFHLGRDILSWAGVSPRVCRVCNSPFTKNRGREKPSPLPGEKKKRGRWSWKRKGWWRWRERAEPGDRPTDLPLHPCREPPHLAVTYIPWALDTLPVKLRTHVHSPDTGWEPNEVVCVGNAPQGGGWVTEALEKREVSCPLPSYVQSHRRPCRTETAPSHLGQGLPGPSHPLGDRSVCSRPLALRSDTCKAAAYRSRHLDSVACAQSSRLYCSHCPVIIFWVVSTPPGFTDASRRF